MQRTTIGLALVVWSSLAMAKAPKKPTAPIEEPAPTEVDVSKVKLDSEVPTVKPDGDDLWTWVSRLEGDAPNPEARAALKEQTEEQFTELALVEKFGTVEVPTEFYQDPVKVLNGDPLALDLIDPKEFDIPVVVNDDVVKWMRYFTGPGRKYYERWLARSTRYRPMMYKKIAEKGLPRDLVYLSMIESGYNTHAYSHADAAGLWQFIPGTARFYKLRVDWWVDERRDPEKATEAGLTFLKELHGSFGDWYLAFASYNTGPGRVKKATVQANSTDFWTIKSKLHSETQNYVPKFIAAAIIGKHPERYGFTGITYQEELTYDKVFVDGTVDLDILAKCAGVGLEQFQELNPMLQRFSTPADGAEVRLPVGRKESFIAALVEIPKSERVASSEHKVRRGDTLASIARKYGVTTSELMKANGLKSANKIFVGMNLAIPRDGSEPAKTFADARSDAATKSKTETPKASKKTKAKYHTVRSGDTLSDIASKYDLSLSTLKKWNDIRGDRILVGQKLKVGGSTAEEEKPNEEAKTADARPARIEPKVPATEKAASSKESTKAASKPSSTTTYVVKPGDSLSAIAAKYDVSISDIQKWNGIRNGSDIQAGQKLALSGGSTVAEAKEKEPKEKQVKEEAEKIHKVRAGDSLGAIAKKYGVTVSQLQKWNGLKSTVIKSGQALRILK